MNDMKDLFNDYLDHFRQLDSNYNLIESEFLSFDYDIGSPDDINKLCENLRNARSDRDAAAYFLANFVLSNSDHFIFD